MSIPQILADISKARAVISNANTVELHRVHEAIEELLAERDKLKADLSKATSRAEDVRTEGLTIGAGNLIIGNFSVPRVITADELREGQLICIHRGHSWGIRAIGTFVNREGDVVTLKTGGPGTFNENTKFHTIVLLEDAPEPEPAPELPKVGDRITTPGTLDALPMETVVLDVNGDAWQKHRDKRWHLAGEKLSAGTGRGLCDYFAEDGQVFTILHLPGGGDDD